MTPDDLIDSYGLTFEWSDPLGASPMTAGHRYDVTIHAGHRAETFEFHTNEADEKDDRDVIACLVSDAQFCDGLVDDPDPLGVADWLHVELYPDTAPSVLVRQARELIDNARKLARLLDVPTTDLYAIELDW